MAKFKVGDRVRLIRDDSGIKEGMTGTVTNVEGALHVPFRPDRITGEECHPYTNGSFAVDEEDLELITASTPQPKFKVGDRVRIRSSATGIYRRLSTGMTGTVDQNYSTCPWVRWDKMLGDNRWCIDQDDLELIEEPQYTQLHPKVGDRVKIISTDNPTNRPVGKEGVVNIIEERYPDETLIGLDNCEGRMYEHRFELITQEPQYTQLHPKVGDKFRVLKDMLDYGSNMSSRRVKGAIVTVEIADDGSERPTRTDLGWIYRTELTTEYLEPIETTIKFRREPEEGDTINVGGMMAEFKPYQYRPNFIIFDECEAEPINKPKKLTLMQTLTSALKRVLSPQLQKFYKVGYINTGLTLTSTGREQYIEALFQNAGDHAKALKDMEANADDMIAQADKE